MHVNDSLILNVSLGMLTEGVYMTKQHVLYLLWLYVLYLVVDGISVMWTASLLLTNVSFKFKSGI